MQTNMEPNEVKSISDFLGIEDDKQLPVVQETKADVEIVPAGGKLPDQEEDYRLARNTFRNLIQQGNQAIDGISELAKQSDSPRAYEVMATLIKTVADTTKDLYDLQKKTKDLKADDKRPQDEQRINVEKAVFVGSPSELLKQIKSKDQ